MRLGIGSYALAWSIGVPGAIPPQPLNHFDLLETALSLGVEAVQYADNLPLEALSQPDLEDLIRIAGERRLILEPGTRGIDPDNLIYLADLAVRLGCGFVRLVLDKGEDQPSPQEARERLRPLHSKLVDRGIKIAIENHDRFPARTLAGLVDSLGVDAFGVCLDTANSLGSLEGPEHVVNTLAPYTVNLHVKDIRIRRVWHNMGFTVEGTAAGEGDLELPWILRQVARAESATIEIWAAQETPGVPPIAQERRMLLQSVTNLRPMLAEISAAGTV